MADKQYLISSKLNKQELFNVILQNPENKTTGQEGYLTKNKLTYLYDKIDVLESSDISSGASYKRLDLWNNYTSDKSEWVLSAYLGNDLNIRVTTLENKSNQLTSTQINYLNNLMRWWKWDSIKGMVYSPYSVYSKGEISAYDAGSGNNGIGGALFLDDLMDVTIDTSSLNDNQFLVYNTITHQWENQTISFTPTSHSHSISDITGLQNNLTFLYDHTTNTSVHLTQEDRDYLNNLKTWWRFNTGSQKLWTPYDVYSEGEISAYGAGSGNGSGSGGGLIQTVYNYNSLGGLFYNDVLTDTFNAYTINQLYLKISSSENIINNLTNWWKLDEYGNLYTERNVYSEGEISAYGAGFGSGSGSGSILYNRLDAWIDYDVSKSEWVLSAYLGNDLNTRLTLVENNQLTSTQINYLNDLMRWWKWDSIKGMVYSPYSVYSKGELSAYDAGSGSGSGSGTMVLDNLADVTIDTGSLTNGQILQFFDNQWVNVSSDVLTNSYTLLSTFNSHVSSNLHITSTERNNWNTAFTYYHTHSNKASIDQITPDDILVLRRLSIDGEYLKITGSAYSTGELSAYGAGSGNGGLGGAISLDNLTDVIINGIPTNNQFLIYDISTEGGKWTNMTIDSFAPSVHTHSFSSISDRPNSLSEYGILDAYTKIETDDNFIPYTGTTYLKPINGNIVGGNRNSFNEDGEISYFAFGKYLNNLSNGEGTGFIYDSYTKQDAPDFAGRRVSLGANIEEGVFFNHSYTSGSTMLISYLEIGYENINIYSNQNNISLDGSGLCGRYNIPLNSTYYVQKQYTDSTYLSKPTGLTVNYIPKWNGSNLNNSLIYDNSTNIGIGTISPSTKLQISTINSTSYLPSTAGFSIQKNEESYGLFAGVEASGNSWLQAGTKTNGTNNLILQGIGGNVGIGRTISVVEKLDIYGNIHLGNGTTGLIRSEKELVFRIDGDEYGTSILRLRNRTDENGVVFENPHPTITLVDFIFKTYVSKRNIRYEARDNYGKAGNPSFHIGGSTPDTPSLAIGDTYITVKDRLSVGSYNYPSYELDVSGSIRATASTISPKFDLGNGWVISGSDSQLQIISGSTVQSVFHNGGFYSIGEVSAYGAGSGGSGGATVLDDLADVTITGAAPNQILQYIGGFWKNVDPNFSSTTGTVTSVGLTTSVPGLAVGPTPVTTSGSLLIGYAVGYSIPTDASQSNWSLAYNHSTSSHAPSNADNTSTTLLNSTSTNNIVDNDSIVYIGASSYLPQKIAWSNIKSTLKNYFDTLYANPITVDSALSSTSTNPVQNKVIYSALSGKAATNQQMYIGTTAFVINRSSAIQTLSGVSIDGNAATATIASKLGSSTIGSSTLPIYLNAGTATAITQADLRIGLFGTAEIGSTSQPIYIAANGVPTAITGIINNSTTGNAATATKLSSNRTFALTGDVTGTITSDLTSGFSITTTIAPNSVALGTDTTGNYVGSVGVSGNGLTITGTAGEGTTFTVNSNATSLNTASTLVFRDASGNFSAGTITAQTDILIPFYTWSNTTDRNSLKKFLELFDLDTAGNLVVKRNLYSTGEITAYSSGTGVSGLKLMGDMNANGKAIYSVNYLQAGLSVQGGSAIIGSDPLGLFGTGMNVGLYNADNDTVIAAYDGYNNEFYYANNSVIFNNNTNTLQSPAFKFGNWTFKEVSGNMVISYNGTAKATIKNSRTNSDL